MPQCFYFYFWEGLVSLTLAPQNPLSLVAAPAKNGFTGKPLVSLQYASYTHHEFHAMLSSPGQNGLTGEPLIRL
jgi:hypothetical protein